MLAATLAEPRSKRRIRRPVRPQTRREDVISTFLYLGRFILVTNARFVPGPGGHVRGGRFVFDQCWIGHSWSTSPARAVMFENRPQAQEYLSQQESLMREMLKPAISC